MQESSCQSHFDCYEFFSRNFCILLDVNECSQESANQCHQMANCTNTNGSYNCTCVAGFSGSGENCSGNYCSWFYLMNRIIEEKCPLVKYPILVCSDIVE